MKKSELGDQRFVVFGAARSGIAAAKLLKSHGYDVVVADEKASCAAAPVIAELDCLNIRSYWGTRVSEAVDARTVMILSPGIPATSPVVQDALKRGVRVISEIELAHTFVSPAARIIAITGTNGKTTTTSWIAHILNGGGFNAVLGGNIGDAWSNSVAKPENQSEKTVFVVETSSFQLEAIEDFHPQVAVLTNLAPDHLDRYPGYEDYVNAKRNILRNMTAEDALIWNYDNPDSHNFSSVATTRLFANSTSAPQKQGAFRRGDQIILSDGATETELLSAAEIPVPGLHNLENALAAALAARLAGADDDTLRRGLKSFPGVEHRIEFCGEQNGVRYYNDSKATNVDSLEKALKSFEQPIVLIAGGRDKHSDYSVLNDLIRKHVKRLVLIGEAAPLMEAAWSSLVSLEHASSMEDATRRAAAAAAPGNVVLLSPACASYDMYNNFEERGADFKQSVATLLSDNLYQRLSSKQDL